MEKNAHYFTVGIFVTIGLFAFFGFLIWLAKPHDSEDYARYTVYFNNSVSGLEVGATVRYLGIRVGKVEETSLAKGRADLVKVNIAVRKDTPVHARTQAMLKTQGITGLIYIELLTDPEDRAPPRQVADETYPVLQGKGSEINDILENMSKFSKDGFGEITAAAREIRKTATSTNDLVKQIKDDPSQLVWSKKKKKDKAPVSTMRIDRNSAQP